MSVFFGLRRVVVSTGVEVTGKTFESVCSTMRRRAQRAIVQWAFIQRQHSHLGRRSGMSTDQQPPTSPREAALPPSGRGRGIRLRGLRALGRWVARIALAVLFVAGFFFSVFPNGRAAVRRVLLLA